MKLIIVNYGAGNIKSIQFAFQRLGVEAILSDNPEEIKNADARGAESGMTTYELAFYDAVANNNSARELMQDDTLREIARILVEKVKQNASIDWTIKDDVKAKIRVIVKRTLRQYGYPPDMQKLATDTVLQQAELLADLWKED